MSEQPLAEIFGFPATNQSKKAQRYRKNRLCPYNNKVANCTKDKANDPLGVCSIHESNGEVAITCPIRFREEWLIAEDAADFFFADDVAWTSLTEVRLKDTNGRSAGNIDFVLVSYDDEGQLLDFGSLEIQAVYISGNVRRPFEMYMQNTETYLAGKWESLRHRPRADYLSSSRKRLVPQLLYKGSILKTWGKKQAVALHRSFYETLPVLKEIEPAQSDMIWLVYDLVKNPQSDVYELQLFKRVYTTFRPSLNQIITPEAGQVDKFVDTLQQKLDEKLDEENNPPDAPTLNQLL